MQVNFIGEETVIGKEYDGTDITIKDYHEALMEMLEDVLNVLEQQHITYFIDGGTLLGAIRHQDIIPWDDDMDLCFMIQDYDKIMNVFEAMLDQNKYIAQSFEKDAYYDVTQPMIKVRKKNTYVEYDKGYFRNNTTENGIFIDFIAISKVPEEKFVNFWYRKTALLRTVALLVFNRMGLRTKWLKKRHMEQANKFARADENSGNYGYALSFVAWQNCIWKENDLFPLKKMPYHRFMINVPQNYDKYLKSLYGDYMQYPNLACIDLLHSKNLKLKSGYVKGEKHGN